MIAPGEGLENGGTLSEGRMSKRKQNLGSAGNRHTPLQAIHILGRFMRLWSVYATYRYLSQPGISVVVFMFLCLFSSTVIFLALQRPWKGRPLSTSQVVPSIINGGITALYFVLWGKGLKSCGPVRFYPWNSLVPYDERCLTGWFTLLHFCLAADGFSRLYVVLVGGLIAMIASFYFLSQGWAMTTYSPFSFKGSSDAELANYEEGNIGVHTMTIPVIAGVLSALRRVFARRVSLKTQWKRRLHAVTIASATCFLFPFAIWESTVGSNSEKIADIVSPSWAYLSTIIFGIVLIYYVDSFAEERLHLIPSSPKHLMVTGSCIIVLEVFYKMDFSLLGFLICSSILGLGMFEATSLERVRRDSVHTQIVAEGDFEDSIMMSPLPS